MNINAKPMQTNATNTNGTDYVQLFGNWPPAALIKSGDVELYSKVCMYCAQHWLVCHSTWGNLPELQGNPLRLILTDFAYVFEATSLTIMIFLCFKNTQQVSPETLIFVRVLHILQETCSATACRMM